MSFFNVSAKLNFQVTPGQIAILINMPTLTVIQKSHETYFAMDSVTQ